MKKYIGTKIVEAEPILMGDFLEKHPERINSNSQNNNFKEEGYLVRYLDGYESWSPKDVFEKNYLQIEPNEKFKSGVSISSQMVDDFIKEIHTSTIGDKTTLVRAVLVNGFEIVETSSCVDVEHYDEKIGQEICLEKIDNKIWELLGFLLQTAWKGINKND